MQLSNRLKNKEVIILQYVTNKMIAQPLYYLLALGGLIVEIKWKIILAGAKPSLEN